jgi:hypothetical protein
MHKIDMAWKSRNIVYKFFIENKKNQLQHLGCLNQHPKKKKKQNCSWKW